jgi:hypothetical protein
MGQPMSRTYYVKALWDADARLWYSQSDIPGLVLESETLAEFEEAMTTLGPELLAENENIHNQPVSIQFLVSETRAFEVI